MVDVRLPPGLQAALEQLPLAGVSGVAARAADLSAAYRSAQSSALAVRDEADVGAYLLTRMPATYAAVLTVLAEAGARTPDFAPKTLLDAGAGPGTASWAALEAFPGIGQATLLDHNPQLLKVAGQLAHESTDAALAGAERVLGEMVSPPLGDRRFDLVVASYALTELSDGQLAVAAGALWARCAGLLVIVEPGRPRDYQRLMAVRSALLAAGATIVAPCPHERACPLPADDWCHFSVRLPRSRSHRQAKGAALGYEDEKFSYLVVARPEISERPTAARVIRPPTVRKFEVELPLCSNEGLVQRLVPKQDAPSFKAAKKLAWGDGVD